MITPISKLSFFSMSTSTVSVGNDGWYCVGFYVDSDTYEFQYLEKGEVEGLVLAGARMRRVENARLKWDIEEIMEENRRSSQIENLKTLGELYPGQEIHSWGYTMPTRAFILPNGGVKLIRKEGKKYLTVVI